MLERPSYVRSKPGYAGALFPSAPRAGLLLCAIFRSCAELRGAVGLSSADCGPKHHFRMAEYSTNHTCRYVRQVSNAMQQHIEYLLRIVSNAQFGCVRQHEASIRGL